MFVHMVFFWLKPEAGEAARNELQNDCRAMLAPIDSVRYLWAGTAVPSDRPVVDSSYDVGLCVTFDDQAGHDLYQDDPAHKAFLAKHKDKWAQVRIFDFV